MTDQALPTSSRGDSGGLSVVRPRATSWFAKRCIDVVIATLLIVLLSPVLATAYLLVRATSKGPGIFRQERVGLNGSRFRIYKFRTMCADSDESVHRHYVVDMLEGRTARPADGLYKLAHDRRVTRVGSWLRASSLDELPQLFNIIRGEMSLVGPRPALPWEVEHFPSWAHARFAVKPGLTGLWQVSGRNRLSMLEALRLDVEYVARATLRMDLVIMLRTFPAVLGKGTR